MLIQLANFLLQGHTELLWTTKLGSADIYTQFKPKGKEENVSFAILYIPSAEISEMINRTMATGINVNVCHQTLLNISYPSQQQYVRIDTSHYVISYSLILLFILLT